MVVFLSSWKLLMCIDIGAGSTPLHYAACGGNLKCCQARIASTLMWYSIWSFLLNMSWCSYFFRSSLQEVQVEWLWIAMGKILLMETLELTLHSLYNINDVNLIFSPPDGFHLMLLGCGGAIGLNLCWHLLLMPQYHHSLLQIIYPFLSWVCSTLPGSFAVNISW